MRQKMLHVSRKIIMFKAKEIFDDKTTDPASRDAFVASREGGEKIYEASWILVTVKNKNCAEWIFIFSRSASILCNACMLITTSV